MKEQWEKHPQWDIEVSNLGRVRSRWRGTGDWYIRKLSRKKYSNGLQYNVCAVGGRGFPVLKVCRLVLETFKGLCPEDRDCRHLDGVSINDHLDNLKWGTRFEQIADQKRHGTFSPPPIMRGEKNPAFKHTDDAYKEAFRLVAEGNSVRSVARMTNISKSQLLRRMRAVEEVA